MPIDGNDLDAELKSLLAAGQKIEAIKRYREATGVGLAEAKDAVEALQRGEAASPRQPVDSALESEIVSLLAGGKKIEAIKVYRKKTGSGLKGAKDAVEAIAADRHLATPSGSGCLGVLVLLVVAVLAGLLPIRLVAVVFAGEPAAKRAPVPILFDTDIMGDVDDVGTVAVLHALANRAEAQILAMGVCVKNPWCPPCLDALNTYFRRPDIPLGVVKGPAHTRASKYAQAIAQEFPHGLKSAEDAPDAAILYRQVLSKQPDRSVVLVSVGQLTNVRNLLKTGPDQYSRLDGVGLVKQKVRVWVCMGGKFPEDGEANFINDGPAAAEAVQNWPTPIVFSGWEIGNQIMTGAGLRKAPAGTPVRRAYELYNGLNHRQSWDQTAVLYAVRGLDGGLAEYWDLHATGHLHVNPDGSNVWRESPDKPHSYLVKKLPPEKIAAVIEALMLRPPTKEL